MKTFLVFGFAISFVNALVNLACYFMGYHADAAGIKSVQTAQTAIFLVSLAVCIVLGTRAYRASRTASDEFGYGGAFGAGLMVSLFASLISSVFDYVYVKVINPDLIGALIQLQLHEMAAKGMNQTQLEQMEDILPHWTTPATHAIIAFLLTLLGGTIISLITGAFLKRTASEAPPLVT